MAMTGKDFEMETSPSRYPEYDDMADDELFDAYDSLLNQDDMDVPKTQYVHRLLELKGYDPVLFNRSRQQYLFSDDTIEDGGGEAETSFTENGVETVDADDKGGETVRIQGSQPKQSTRSESDSFDLNVTTEDIRLAFDEQDEIKGRLQNLSAKNRKLTEIKINKIKILNNKIYQISGKKLSDDPASVEITNRSRITGDGTVDWVYKKEDETLGGTYKLLIKGQRGKTIYTKSTNRNVMRGVEQFKELVRQIPTKTEKEDQLLQDYSLTNPPENDPGQNQELMDRLNSLRNPNEMFDVIETTTRKTGNISGLTPEENRELQGVIKPPDSIDPKSRIGPNGALQIQVDYFKEKMDSTDNTIIETNDPLEIENLNKRKTGLKEAVKLTQEQLEKETIRAEQEEDISRYEKLKEYVKEHFGEIAGVSSILIGVASIITTVVVAGRMEIYKGASATYNFAETVYNTFKKTGRALGPYLGPIFSAVAGILSTLIKLGGKGLSWLANNLWVLIVFIFWFLRDYYKERRHRKT